MQHKVNIQRVTSAVERVANLDFYVCFLRFEDLRLHGKLLPHEAVRAKNQLTILDTFSDVKTFIDNNQVAFISHQCFALARAPACPRPRLQPQLHPLALARWLAGRSPDPEGVHFKAIIDAVMALQSRLLEENDPKADKPFYVRRFASPRPTPQTGQETFSTVPARLARQVWLDYVSIPQANKTLQSLSISSLALYASMPDYFLVVAPPATHVDTRCACDKETYLRRGWCAHS